ncbi:hypothetical protein AGLY_013111 [Aphis glycines]|uniref:Uncharacterized protein n=1 Tax=Aphis glycines TaxID=307491 RepID=A0A6G0T838_APHGL|nr:hypothetical protein AGLY_013111 [Aphis glycines]
MYKTTPMGSRYMTACTDLVGIINSSMCSFRNPNLRINRQLDQLVNQSYVSVGLDDAQVTTMDHQQCWSLEMIINIKIIYGLQRKKKRQLLPRQRPIQIQLSIHQLVHLLQPILLFLSHAEPSDEKKKLKKLRFIQMTSSQHSVLGSYYIKFNRNEHSYIECSTTIEYTIFMNL